MTPRESRRRRPGHPKYMLLPHPHLRLADLRNSHSIPSLTRLIDEAGVHRFFNARAALYHLARSLGRTGRRTILLPAFHCPSVVVPILRAGMRVAFYRVDRNLGIDLDDVRRRLDDDVAAALFINYFGFPSAFEPLLGELRARGVFVIEDCAHSCVSSDPLALSGRRADAAVYSFWKLVPSVAGGGLWLSAGTPMEFPVLRRAPLSDSLKRAKRLGEQVIFGLGEDSMLARAYAWAERSRVKARAFIAGAVAPSQPPGAAAPAESYEYFFSERLAGSRLPWTAEKIMSRADLATLIGARRRNYETLANALDGVTPFPSMLPALAPRISPLAYPIVVPDRSSHDLRLRARGVPVWTFGSTLHRVLFEVAAPGVIEDAKYLSDNVLLLSIHHMFNARDMIHFADVINQFCPEAASCALT